jgi:NitT/TauT family transport system substrate-binding protein
MSGEVAISQGGVTGSITSNLKGSGTYIILGGADRFPYQLVAQPNIKQISELKGKRFAVSRIGSADHTATMFVLPKLGIQPDKELNIVQVGSVPARFAALVNSAVQGALLIPPETVIGEVAEYPIAELPCFYRHSLPTKRGLHHACVYQQKIRHSPSLRDRLL